MIDQARKHLNDTNFHVYDGIPKLLYDESESESLTQKNKEQFNDCLKFKKDHSYKFLWTNAGKIFLRRDADSPVIPVYSSVDIPPSPEA